MSTDPAQNELADYLTFATDLAREAGRITLKYFRGDIEVEWKSDDSPVTIADRETERLIRDRISERYPDHALIGEEFGQGGSESPWRWVIDPIDGTRGFVRGIPLYTVLIALERDGDPVLGVIHNPPMDETVAAASGLGCSYNGRPCRVSQRADLTQAEVHTTDWAQLYRRRPELCRALLAEGASCRTWADGYGYLMVATGRADIMLDPVVHLWDWAPLKPVILEAGGRFTDLDGDPAVASPHALATNGSLHDRVLELTALDR